MGLVGWSSSCYRLEKKNYLVNKVLLVVFRNVYIVRLVFWDSLAHFCSRTLEDVDIEKTYMKDEVINFCAFFVNIFSILLEKYIIL